MSTKEPGSEHYPKVKAKSKILFEYRGSVEQGDVLRVEKDHEGKIIVSLVWLSGHNTRNEYIELNTVLTVGDETAERGSFGGWTGRFVVLPAGLQWQKDHPDAD
jgi:hypothetical protein